VVEVFEDEPPAIGGGFVLDVFFAGEGERVHRDYL
jgi:hypothetical protein